MLIKIRNILKNTPVLKNKFLFVISIFNIVMIGSMLYLQISSTPFYVWIIPIFCIIEMFITIFLYEYLNKIHRSISKDNNKNGVIIFITCFVIVLIGQIVYWIAYYPGGFNLDALGQWDQVHGVQQLNNWHPVLTTFFYWILSQINDSIEFCIIVQLVLFSFSVSYLLKELYVNGINKWFVIMASVVISINPAIGMNNICLIKDVPFTIVIIWITILMYKIYLSDGKWVRYIKNRILLICLITALSLIRHNAIFISVPFIIIAMIIFKKYSKYFLKIIIFSSLLLVAIETVGFSLLRIQQHSNVTGEISGIPMAIMVNAYVNDYENTPSDVRNFLEEIAPRNEWKKTYIIGEWDSCKWEFGGIDLLKENSIFEVLYMMYETIICCPQTSYESVRENTKLVWQVVGESYWSPWVYIEENDYGIKKKNTMINIENLVEWSENNILTSTAFWNIGFLILILLILNWIAFARGKYKSILFLGPIIIYDIMTMCLLSGPSFRYFYFNSALIFPVTGIVLGMIMINEKNS